MLAFIRKNIKFIVFLIVLSMIIFVVTDLIGNLNRGVSFSNAVGEVYGEEISLSEYNAKVDQVLANNPNVDNATAEQYIQQTFDGLVNEIIMGREYDAAGIKVGAEDELNDLLTGKGVSAIAKQYLSQPGMPFDPNQVKQILANAQQDEKMKAQVDNLIQYIMDSRQQEKFFFAVKSGMMPSENEIVAKYNEDNRKVSFSFLSVNYNVIADSLVTVSDYDYEKYYESHKEAFKQEDETFIKYVKFEKKPQKEDSIAALTKITNVISGLKKTTDEAKFFAENGSETPLDTTWKRADMLSPTISALVSSIAVDSVVGPFPNGQLMQVFKLVGIKEDTVPNVRIRHILIPVMGATKEDTIKAKTTAADVFKKTTSANFGEMVFTHSMDFGTKNNGGELGWYVKGMYGPEFDEAVLSAAKGKIIGPIKSPQGYHIIEILDRTNKLYQAAEFSVKIEAGNKTIDALFKDANIFAAEVQQSGNIEQSATNLGFDLRVSPGIKTNMTALPGLVNSKEIAYWALNGEEGALSPVFNMDDAFVVAMITEKKEKGYKSLDDVKTQIERPVINIKKAGLIMEKLSTIKDTDLEKIKTAYGPGAFVSAADNITFNSQYIPGIGSDNYMLGKLFTLKKDELSAPIRGMGAVYIVKITNVVEPTPLTPEEITSRRNSALITKQTGIDNRLYQGLREIADIKDFRYKLFRPQQ